MASSKMFQYCWTDIYSLCGEILISVPFFQKRGTHIYNIKPLQNRQKNIHQGRNCTKHLNQGNLYEFIAEILQHFEIIAIQSNNS